MRNTGLLLIRVKGGASIGLGHVFRTMAVAEVVRALPGMSVLFLHNGAKAVWNLLEARRFDHRSLDDGPHGRLELSRLLARLEGAGSLVYLADSKEDLREEITLIRTQGIPVVLMDNMTPARLSADVNIYPVAHFDHTSLDWTGYGGEVQGGGDWVPVARRILDARTGLRSAQERGSILVTMGGEDPNGLTLRVMEALRDLDPAVEVRVVLGFAFGFKDEAYRLNKKMGGRFTLIENVTDMEKHMAEAGLAITALGTTIYELACLGVPTIVISNYREDARDERVLNELGWVTAMGYHGGLLDPGLRESIVSLWQDPMRRAAMSSRGSSLIDGRGAERIADEVVHLVTVQLAARRVVAARRM
jgi:spore coat polysaccharide biosynthesis predicted glycosyltransferase SpsG